MKMFKRENENNCYIHKQNANHNLNAKLNKKQITITLKFVMKENVLESICERLKQWSSKNQKSLLR